MNNDTSLRPRPGETAEDTIERVVDAVRRGQETIGQRLRRLRVAAGLSQRQLSVPGVTYAFISRIEAGDRMPSLRSLVRLAERLDVSALYLLTGEHDCQCPVCGREAMTP